MQEVCDVLERLLGERLIRRYAIGGATAAGFHGDAAVFPSMFDVERSMFDVRYPHRSQSGATRLSIRRSPDLGTLHCFPAKP